MKRLVIFYLGAFAHGLCMVVVPAASVALRSADGNAIGDARYGALTLPLLLGAAATTFALGPALERFGRRRVFLAGLAADGLFVALLAATVWTRWQPEWSFALAFAAQLSLGVGFGWLVSLLNVLADEAGGDRSDAAVSGLHAMLGLGSSASPLLFNVCAGTGHWQSMAIPIAVLLVSIGLATWLMNAVPVTAQSVEAPRIRTLPGGAWLFLLVLGVYGLAESIVAYWTGAFLSAGRGVSAATANDALSTFWICVTLGRLAASPMTLWIPTRWIYLLSGPGIVLGVVALYSTDATWTTPVFALLGLAFSVFFPLSYRLAAAAYPAHREAISALSVTVLMVGYNVTNFSIGWLVERDVVREGELFIGVGACAALFAALAWVTVRNATPDPDENGGLRNRA